MVIAYPNFLAEGLGLCREPWVDPDLFADCGERGATREKRVRRAKAVCNRCEYRLKCELYALQTGQVGVWGGTTDEERVWTLSRGVQSDAA